MSEPTRPPYPLTLDEITDRGAGSTVRGRPQDEHRDDDDRDHGVATMHQQHRQPGDEDHQEPERVDVLPITPLGVETGLVLREE